MNQFQHSANLLLVWLQECHWVDLVSFSTVHISPYKYKTFKINFFLMTQIYVSKEWKSSYQITFVSKLELSSFFKKEVTATSQFILIKKDLTFLTPCRLLYFILWSLKALYYVSSYFLYLTHFYILKLAIYSWLNWLKIDLKCDLNEFLFYYCFQNSFVII